MAEVTNELMYELLKTMHTDIDLKDVRRFEASSFDSRHMAMQSDINNIYGISAA